MNAPRFAMTYCSQFGCETGPGDSGYSHCADHIAAAAARRARKQPEPAGGSVMVDYADKDYLHEMAPAALPVLVAAALLAVLMGVALADWWAGGELVTGAVECVVLK